MQGASALPAAAGQVVGTTAAKAGNRGKRRKEQWLEAQEATGHSQRPQDEHGWQVDNSNAPFKGQLDHWRRYVQVSCCTWRSGGRGGGNGTLWGGVCVQTDETQK